MCDINWIVSGDVIEVTETSEEDLVDPVFGFWDEILPSEGALFSRVRSSLRMSQEDVINTNEENFTVTCIGEGTEYGEAVESTTTVIIECKIKQIIRVIKPFEVNAIPILRNVLVTLSYYPRCPTERDCLCE